MIIHKYNTIKVNNNNNNNSLVFLPSSELSILLSAMQRSVWRFRWYSGIVRVCLSSLLSRVPYLVWSYVRQLSLRYFLSPSPQKNMSSTWTNMWISNERFKVVFFNEVRDLVYSEFYINMTWKKHTNLERRKLIYLRIVLTMEIADF